MFSDKTGTLTCNKMDFMCATIAGVQYGLTPLADLPQGSKCWPGCRVAEYSFRDPACYADMVEKIKEGDPVGAIIEDFWTLLAVCHSVIPDVDDVTGASIIATHDAVKSQRSISKS